MKSNVSFDLAHIFHISIYFFLLQRCRAAFRHSSHHFKVIWRFRTQHHKYGFSFGFYYRFHEVNVYFASLLFGRYSADDPKNEPISNVTYDFHGWNITPEYTILMAPFFQSTLSVARIHALLYLRLKKRRRKSIWSICADADVQCELNLWKIICNKQHGAEVNTIFKRFVGMPSFSIDNVMRIQSHEHTHCFRWGENYSLAFS